MEKKDFRSITNEEISDSEIEMLMNSESANMSEEEMDKIYNDAMTKNQGELKEEALKFTRKQNEFWVYSREKYNLKVGAAGVGKTFMDTFLIPAKLRETVGDVGNKNVIIGTTLTTAKRNVIEPMQEMFGPAISNVSSSGYCVIFGKVVHIFGAEKSNSTTKIQGTNIEFAYGDEVATWSEEFFDMLLSRLRLDYSKFYGTCNPEGPNHWLKKFIDRSIESGNMYHQHYVLGDGTLSEEVKASQRETLTGVAYKRLVLGEWARAEGLIYDKFAESPDDYLVDLEDIPPLRQIVMGVDPGQNVSKHAIVATGVTEDYDVIVLATEIVSGGDEAYMAKQYIKLMRIVERQFGLPVNYTYSDSARTTGIYALRNELRRNNLDRVVVKSTKMEVVDRISGTNTLIGQGRLWYTEMAKDIKDSFLNAVWDESSSKDKRLDENTDILDAFEYSIENDLRFLLSV